MDDFKHKGIFIIRYGITITLILLLIMIWFMMDGIRIRQFTDVNLIQKQPLSYIAIFRSDSAPALHTGDTIQIHLEDASLKFQITGTKEQSGYLEIGLLDPLPSFLADKHFIEGKIIGEEVSLWRLIFTWKIKGI